MQGGLSGVSEGMRDNYGRERGKPFARKLRADGQFANSNSPLSPKDKDGGRQAVH